jgi:signal transduction histidine kinase
VGQLASGLAHEIGTPLNIIAGNAQLLGMELRDRSLDTAAVDAIVQHADRITGLIQQLLAFARAKEQAMAVLAVQAPLAKVLRLLETRFKHQGITVITEGPAGHSPAVAPSNSNRCSSMCWSMPGMLCPTGARSP